MSSITLSVCLPRRVDTGLFEAIVRASSIACGSNSSGEVQASTMPRRYSSAPGTRTPVSIMRRRRE